MTQFYCKICTLH